jgi:hypothetical protein
MLIGPFRETARKNDIIALIKKWVISSSWFEEKSRKDKAEDFNAWASLSHWLILQKKLRTIATTLLDIWSTQSIDIRKFSDWYPKIIPFLIAWDAPKAATMIKQLRDDVTSVLRPATSDIYQNMLDSWTITQAWISSPKDRIWVILLH